MNPTDPWTFLILALVAGVVLIGTYYFLREIGADAMDLHEKRQAQRRERDRREGRIK